MLTTEEIAFATTLIDQTQSYMTGTLRLLKPEMWSARPGEGQWTIGQHVEHIVAVQNRVLGLLRGPLKEAGPAPAGQDTQAVDRLILATIPARTQKFNAPEPLRPVAGVDADPKDVEQRFAANCDAYREIVRSTPDLRDHAAEAAPVKAISGGVYTQVDGYQWVLLAALHTERHTKQILEIVAGL